MTSDAEPLYGFQWNECPLDGIADKIHPFLVTLICLEPNLRPQCIGTAFIVGSYGSSAIAISAAHNFWLGIGEFQNSNPRQPTSAWPLNPEFEKINVGWLKVRAIYQVGERIELCTIKYATWDKEADIAVLELMPDDEQDSTIFNNHFRVGNITPKVGDIVGCLGYNDMDTLQQEDNDWKKWHIQRRATFRVGRILKLHPEGCSLARGSCVETSIPVFGGMSGGPVFLLPERGMEFVPFALISYDPEEPDEVKNDRSKAGSSIMAVLPLEFDSEDKDNKRHFKIRLNNINFSGKVGKWIPD